MSFTSYFEKLDLELKQTAEQYIRKADEHPNQLQKIMAGNQKKLEIFIQNFQNQLCALKKAEERDCKMIENLRYQNQQRRSQNILIENATKMQQGIVERLRKSVNALEETNKQIQRRAMKHQQNMNRSQLQLDKLQSKRDSRNSNIIQIDKQNSKLIIKIQKTSNTKIHEIIYSKRDDKFMINSSDKSIIQIVKQFNFHRNLNKMYDSLYYLS